MDNQKIGKLIMELRKSKNLTQKELADILKVTDKAVSKWERGVGYPEITLLPELADALGISVGELLNGSTVIKEQTEISLYENESASSFVSDVIEYSEQFTKQKLIRKNILYLTIITAAFLIAIFVCLICNFSINRKIDWSLYVLGSEVTAWLVIAPFFLFKRYQVIISLAGLSISILPLLNLIEYLCPVKGWVLPFAAPIAVMSLVCLWLTILMFTLTNIDRVYLIAFTFILIGMVLNLGINAFVNSYLKSASDNISNQITAIVCGFIGIMIFLYVLIKKKLYKESE